MKRILGISGFLLMLGAGVVTAQENYEAEMYVEGIDIPWGMDWLPNGDMLITERSGELYLVRDGEIVSTISNLPDDIDPNRQGGFLDVKVHPNADENGWIYFTYSASQGEGSGSNTALVRARLEGTSLTDYEVIYKATPNNPRGFHYGSRIDFDPDGYVYFTIGDRGQRDDLPQDITKDGGKVYRLHDDGRIPADNPFVNVEGAKTATYSYGHRNPQGMEVHPVTGKMWAHEHGPQGGDELNIIEPGKNYGWPVLSYGINYNGTEFAEGTEREGMEHPVVYWVPSIAPSGMAFVTSDRYPEWKGHLIIGSLKFAKLELLELEGEEVVSKTDVLPGIGRVRSVEQGPDGYIYVGTDRGGIKRIVPKS
ncbi:MAG: PQQ-dependent sugar dehydrogenase [Balneolales bacterium]|nr:PQQ-dependent sugar dehydrogenase [Balneolales bacterium]